MTPKPNANPKLVTKLLDLPTDTPKTAVGTPTQALSWGEPLAQSNRPAANNYRPAGLDQWLAWIARGSDDQIKEALVQFETHRPATAVPDLLHILTDRKIKEDNRLAALFALSVIGHPSAVPELLAQENKLPFSLQKELCYVLFSIGDPRALPYFLEEAKNGLYAARAFALFGIAQSGSPEAFPSLVQDSQKELQQIYMEADNNPLQGSSNFWLGLAGAAYSGWQQDKWATRNATLMTNPYITLGAVLDAPGEVQRVWLLHLRQAVLTHLVTVCGPQGLLATRPQAKRSMQRLMITTTMLDFQGPTDEYFNDLTTSAKSRFMGERLLAYEQFVILSGQTNDPRFQEWALRGLQDKDKLLRGALAAAIIFSHVTPLLPHAYEFARHKSADVRASMVAPLVLAALDGQHSANELVQALRQDRDQGVRQHAERLWLLGQQLQSQVEPPPPTPPAPPAPPVRQQMPVSPPPAPPSVPQAPVCPGCGQAARAGARFCARCGTRLG